MQTKNTIEKIIQAIIKAPVIICQRHQNPDPDAIGSQMGLAEIIRHSYPEKKVYSVGCHDEGLKWMGIQDTIPDSTYKNALVIVTDCANRPRISDQRYNQGQMLIKIDHHPNVDQYGDLQWVNPQKSSASEMIADLVAASDKLTLDDKAASLLYAGIIGDTGRFMFPGVTAHTFNVVAELSKYHFSMNEVNLHETMTTLEMSKMYGELEANLQADHGMAYYIVTQKMMKKYHIPNDMFISKNLPGNIYGIVAWAMFKELPDGTYKVSLRSHKPEIESLAMKHHGGGHPLASGAMAKDKNEIKQIIKQLKEIVERYQTIK